MIAVYCSDSLQAQIVQAICAAHRLEARVLDTRVRLQRQLSGLRQKGVSLALLVIEHADLQRNGYSVQRLRAELKAAGGRGRVALVFPRRVLIDPLIERWSSVDQGALMAIPAMNLSLREATVLPVADEIAGALGLSFDSRRTMQFVNGLNPAVFAQHPMARLHLQAARLAELGVSMADLVDWLDEFGDLKAETRVFMLRSYEECVLGSQIIESLATRFAVDQPQAMEIGNWLIDAGLLCHVARERSLEPDYFFRFLWPSARLKPIRIAKTVARMSDADAGVTCSDRSFRPRRNDRLFMGRDAVTWLRGALSVGFSDAVTCATALVNLGIVHAIEGEECFSDGDDFYRFTDLGAVLPEDVSTGTVLEA